MTGVMAWPLWFRFISTAMSFFGPPMPRLHAVDQAIEHVGGVEFAVDELVAHAGPVGFLARRDLDAVLLVQAQRGRHDHRGAVRQRDEADADVGFFRGVGAVPPRRRCAPADPPASSRRPRRWWPAGGAGCWLSGSCVGGGRDHGGGQGLGVFEARGHGDGSEKEKGVPTRSPPSPACSSGRRCPAARAMVDSADALFRLSVRVLRASCFGTTRPSLAVQAITQATCQRRCGAQDARKTCRKSRSGGSAGRVRPGSVRTVSRGGARRMDGAG